MYSALWNENRNANDETWKRIERWFDEKKGACSFKKAVFGSWSGSRFIRNIRYRRTHRDGEKESRILDRYFNKT